MDCHTRRITKSSCTVAVVQESTVLIDHVSKKLSGDCKLHSFTDAEDNVWRYFMGHTCILARHNASAFVDLSCLLNSRESPTLEHWSNIVTQHGRMDSSTGYNVTSLVSHKKHWKVLNVTGFL